MYTLSRSVADVVRSQLWKLEYPYQITAEFKRPLVLPARNVSVQMETIPCDFNPDAASSLPGLLPPASDISNGKAVSFGVYSEKGVPHMKASFVTLKK